MADIEDNKIEYTEKSTIKNWFRTGLKPLQNHFWQWMDSYWHKSEKLPISSVDKLEEILTECASLEDLDAYILRTGANLKEEDIELLRKILEVPTINPEELGKVDTVDGVAPDENKNVQLNALVKNKVNEVGKDFALKSGDATVRFDRSMMKITNDYVQFNVGSYSQSGFTITCKDIVGRALNMFAHGFSGSDDSLTWSLVSQKGRTSLFMPITGNHYRSLVVSWNGVFADKNGNIDADVEPYIDDYFDKETITLKNIPDKTQDATFNQLVGMNNVTKELGVVGGSAAVNSILSMDNNDPALIALTYKLNGTFSSSTRITTNGIFPPVLAEGNGVKTLTVLGRGLILPEDENITKVQIVHLQTMNIYDVGWKNIKDNSLEVYVNSSLYPLGEYKIKILSGVQAHITLTSFEILDASSVTEIPTNSLVWEWYKNPQSTITEAESGIDVIEPNLVRSNQVGLFGETTPRVQDTLISNIINDTGDFTITAEVYFDMPDGEYKDNAFGLVKDLNHETSIISFPYEVYSITRGRVNAPPPIKGVSLSFRYKIRTPNFKIGKYEVSGSGYDNKYPNGKGIETLIITRKGNKLYTAFGEWIYVEDVNQSDLFRLVIVNCAAPASSNQMEVKIRQIQTFRSELYRK
ncbi:hypothetical protein QP547_01080 [Weeksella virosa]|uniref:hypothetical protein n=1 Tax=Weeksella virosa TaxID=1014 RepID=UPI0025575AC4|nr:hypothetical protein [Weeksella virosa]MDK7674403.1 hypothetical protein [Weeksella virosa]